MFFSAVNNSAAQIANAISTMMGIWDTVIGEARRKYIRTTSSQPPVENSYPLMAAPAPQPYMSPESSDQGLESKFGGYPTSTAHSAAPPQRMRKTLPILFALALLIINYIPIPLHVAFGYVGKPIPEIVIIPISSASNNITNIPSFYSEIATPLYSVVADYRAPDIYDNKQSGHIFPLFNASRPWSLQGSTFFQYQDVTCLISDRFEEMIMQTGFRAHYNAYPSLPVMPILKCKDDSSGYSMFVTNSNYTSNSSAFEPYTTALKQVLGVNQNVTGVSIVPSENKIYATTLYIEDYSFDNVGGVDNSTLYRMMNESFPVNETVIPENDWAQYSKDGVILSRDSLESTLSLMQRDFAREVSFVVSYHYYNVSASTTQKRAFTRTMFSYNGVGGYISVSKLYYATRQLSYEITAESPKVQPYFEVQQSTADPAYLDAQVFSLLTNIKVAPTVGGALLKTTEYEAAGLQGVTFTTNGKLVYDVTALVGTIIGIIGVSIALAFFVYIVWYKRPKGIPFYYALLHEYHQNTSRSRCDKSIFDMVSPAYEGEGYVESSNVNHIGILDARSITEAPRASVPYSDKPL